MQAVGLSLLLVSLLLAVGLRLPLLERWSALGLWLLLWGLLAFAACAVTAHRLAPEWWPDPADRGEDPTRDCNESPEHWIRRRVRLDALQHPATVVPLAVAAVAAGYLLLGPSWGRATAAAVIIAISLVVAVTSFIWRYAARYSDEYVRVERQLWEVEERETQSLQLTLERGFADAASAAGRRALDELEREYSQLRPALDARREEDPLSVARLPALAAETYRRGLSVLADALELTEAMRGSGRERLQAEITQLEREASSSLDWRPAGRVEIREATLVSHRERVALLDQLQLHVDQLLHQAGRCEASMHRTRIELAAIRTGSSVTSVNNVVEALRGTIEQAKEVQLKLKRLGY